MFMVDNSRTLSTQLMKPNYLVVKHEQPQFLIFLILFLFKSYSGPHATVHSGENKTTFQEKIMDHTPIESKIFKRTGYKFCDPVERGRL